MSGMAAVFLMELRTSGKPLPQNIVLLHFHLECWTQANVRFDFGLGFTLEPCTVFCSQLCDRQFKVEFLLALFQTSQGSQFLFELLISEFLGAYLAAFVALRRVNIASAELCKEKTVRILNGSAMSFFCNLNTRLRDVKKVLEVFHCI